MLAPFPLGPNPKESAREWCKCRCRGGSRQHASGPAAEAHAPAGREGEDGQRVEGACQWACGRGRRAGGVAVGERGSGRGGKGEEDVSIEKMCQ